MNDAFSFCKVTGHIIKGNSSENHPGGMPQAMEYAEEKENKRQKYGISKMRRISVYDCGFEGTEYGDCEEA